MALAPVPVQPQVAIMPQAPVLPVTAPAPEEITLASDTPSNLTCRLLNKNGTPVRNVIVQIDAGEKIVERHASHLGNSASRRARPPGKLAGQPARAPQHLIWNGLWKRF